MEQNETKVLKSSKKNADNFCCELCHFRCSKKSNYMSHLSTRKHQNKENEKNETNMKQVWRFKCACNKVFKSRTTLWRHKKVCEEENDYANEDNTDNEVNINADTENKDEIITMLIKQNAEFTRLIKEILGKSTGTTNNTTNNITNNTTTNNNKFNLNLFLNEQCKDAINLMDFVQSLKLELTELENIGKLGYAEGISKIFVKGLKELDVHKRPIHCSDLKREVLYIKDQNAWEKENEDKTKIKQAIKQIEHKNIKNIQEWINKHPDSKFADSPKNDQYMKIISNSMGGSTNEEDEKNYNKIIKKLASEVLIEK
jgi:hypothetical protein